MFSGFEISKCPDFRTHLNQYDVLFLNMQDFLSQAESAEHVTEYLQKVILRDLKQAYKDIVDFAGKVPGIDYGAYYSDIRSALTDAITNVVQNGADIDSEIKNAQDTVEFNINE